MKYADLVKDIRAELSEVTMADREKAYVRAEACLLHIKKLIEQSLKGSNENEKTVEVD